MLRFIFFNDNTKQIPTKRTVTALGLTDNSLIYTNYEGKTFN